MALVALVVLVLRMNDEPEIIVIEPPQTTIDDSIAGPSQQVKPALVKYVPPVYSVAARMRGLEGDVVVEAHIGADGRVLDAEIRQGVDPLLDEAALTAARQTEWTPGTDRGIPVECWMALPYRFELKQDEQ